jgi:hypothetical protein
MEVNEHERLSNFTLDINESKGTAPLLLLYISVSVGSSTMSIANDERIMIPSLHCAVLLTLQQGIFVILVLIYRHFF